MIQYDPSFFEDEIRDGWLVNSDMKRMWAAEIEVLMEIDRICKRHDISYFADFGTLLGAVRHNGYIPWDDDLDIVMFREDYMKFLKIAGKELEDPLICADIYRQGTWSQPFARVMNGTGIHLERCFLERYHGCPYSVGIDIFVLDHMPESQEEFYLIKALYALVHRLDIALGKQKEEKDVTEVEEETLTDEEIENYLCQVEELCQVTIDRRKNVINQLLRIRDGVGALNAGNRSDEVFDISFIPHNNYFYAGSKREWYREALELPFENIKIPVPVDYDKVLKMEFGDYQKGIKKPGHTIFFRMNREMRMVKRNVKDMNEKLEKLAGALEKG